MNWAGCAPPDSKWESGRASGALTFGEKVRYARVISTRFLKQDYTLASEIEGFLAEGQSRGVALPSFDQRLVPHGSEALGEGSRRNTPPPS